MRGVTTSVLEKTLSWTPALVLAQVIKVIQIHLSKFLIFILEFSYLWVVIVILLHDADQWKVEKK